MGLQEKEGTSIPICSYSFFSNLIFGYSVDTLAPLYMHFLFSELEEPLKRLSVRSQPWGAHCCRVCYHLSFLECHSRAKELCVQFAQLLHLHVMMTSRFPAICLIKKSLWLDWKILALSLCLATWTSSTPVSWRSSGLGSPIFLNNCVR